MARLLAPARVENEAGRITSDDDDDEQGDEEGEELFVDVVDHHHQQQQQHGDRSIMDASAATDHEASSPIQLLRSKRYHCQRCLNHGLLAPRKNHKKRCLYATCDCKDCMLVHNRKLLNREISKEAISAAFHPIDPPVATPEQERAAFKIEEEKTRRPKCSRCRAHNPNVEPPPLKGHKKACPYQKCECRKCALVKSRREVMALQIRLRRRQISKRSRTADERSSGASMIMKSSTYSARSPSPSSSSIASRQSATTTATNSSAIYATPAASISGGTDAEMEQRHISGILDAFNNVTDTAITATNPLMQCQCRCTTTTIGDHLDAAVSKSIQNHNHSRFYPPIFQPTVADVAVASMPSAAAETAAAASAQTLFVGFLEYLKQMVAATTSSSPPQQARTGGLILPTAPAIATPAPALPSVLHAGGLLSPWRPVHPSTTTAAFLPPSVAGIGGPFGHHQCHAAWSSRFINQQPTHHHNGQR